MSVLEFIVNMLILFGGPWKPEVPPTEEESPDRSGVKESGQPPESSSPLWDRQIDVAQSR
jgi:hypothetical protein